MLRLITVAGALLLAANPVSAQTQKTNTDIQEQVRKLGRGVNLGNMLEAPREGAWGLTLKEDYFPLIKAAGFDSVRIPIRWSAHADSNAPYEMNKPFLRRVDRAIDEALKSGLTVVLNMHHYDEIFLEPAKHRARFFALWRQIAEHYRDKPSSLIFELLNEPHNQLTAELWNDMLAECLQVVRKTNPTRAVIIGPGGWNNFHELKKLKLPKDDKHLIVTFHYYDPFPFTHQGANWVQDGEKYLGTRWSGNREELEKIRADFDVADAWAKQEGRPIYLGEFGAFSRADMDSRVRWTASVRAEAEKRGMAWAYWELAAGFGVYDPESKTWRGPVLKALIPPKSLK